MINQWNELKETIIELRDNDGTGTQQEVCTFLTNLMDILEKQMEEQNNSKGGWQSATPLKIKNFLKNYLTKEKKYVIIIVSGHSTPTFGVVGGYYYYYTIFLIVCQVVFFTKLQKNN